MRDMAFMTRCSLSVATFRLSVPVWLPHSRVMIHQPLGGAQGQASDIEITAREILKVKKELYTIISTHSGQPYEKVEHDSDRDYWMTAEEALAYGMIDKVLIRNK